MSLTIAPNPNDYQIVPYVDPEQQRRDRPTSTVRNWPNRQSYTTAISIAFTTICGVANAPLRDTLIVNALRGLDAYEIYKEKNYIRIAFHIAAFTALFFPYGKVGSVLIDLAYETFNYYKPSIKRIDVFPCVTRLKDPKIKENALKILTVPEERADDLDFIKEQHRWRSELLISKLESVRPRPTPFVAAQLQYMLDNINEAYKTLTAGLE